MLLGRTHLTLPPDEQEKYNRYVASRLKANNNNKMKVSKFYECKSKFMQLGYVLINPIVKRLIV